MSVLLQRQIMTGVSLSAGYYRKQFYNFTVQENLLFEPSHYKEYCVRPPSTRGCPTAAAIEMCGLYDVDQAVFGRGHTGDSARIEIRRSERPTTDSTSRGRRGFRAGSTSLAA